MLQSFPLVRLAALDLDGTLLNRNNEVTLATRQAIARAVEHGVVVVPATGRPLASLPPVVAKLPGIRYAITSNGAAVWDLGDDPMGAVHSRYANAAQRHTSEPACLLHRLMPTEVAREAFDLFQQYDGELSVFSDGLAIKTPEGIAKLTSRTARFLSSEARQNLTAALPSFPASRAGCPAMRTRSKNCACSSTAPKRPPLPCQSFRLSRAWPWCRVRRITLK